MDWGTSSKYLRILLERRIFKVNQVQKGLKVQTQRTIEEITDLKLKYIQISF